MHLLRLSLIALLPLALAACDNSPKPPANPPAAAAPATAAPAAPAAAAPAAKPVAASSDASAPVIGTWAATPAACADTAQQITISATRFEGAENSCDIGALADNGDGSLTAALSCTAEGQKADESVKMTPIFAPSGEGITLTYLDRDNAKANVYRCK